MAEARFLLDANCCIYLIEQTSSPLRSRVEMRAPGEVVTSAIAFAEVALGTDWTDAGAADVVSNFFAVVPVVEFEESAGRAYAQVP